MKWKIVGVTGLIVGLGISIAMECGWNPTFGFSAQKSEARFRALPRVFQPTVRDCSWAVNSAQLQLALRRLRLPSSPSWPELLHAARMSGQDGRISAVWSAAQIAQLALDSDKFARQFNGGVLHQVTSEGVALVRIKRIPGITRQMVGDPHPGKTLSVLGKLGVSSLSKLNVRGNVLSLFDVLRRDALNFVKTDETSWLTLAFVFYCEDGIVDKFQRETTLSQMLLDLSKVKPSHSAACLGVHPFMTVAFALSIDQQDPFLTTSARKELRNWAAQRVNVLSSTQSAEGCWEGNWSGADSATIISDTQKTMLTGHIIETLAALDSVVTVPDEIIGPALQYSTDKLLSATEFSLESEYTSWTHLANGLKMWTQTGIAPER